MRTNRKSFRAERPSHRSITRPWLAAGCQPFLNQFHLFRVNPYATRLEELLQAGARRPHQRGFLRRGQRALPPRTRWVVPVFYFIIATLRASRLTARGWRGARQLPPSI